MRYMKHLKIILLLERDSIIMITLVKFEVNLKMYIDVIRYLVQAYISQRP